MFTNLITNHHYNNNISRTKDMSTLRFAIEAMCYLSTEYSIKYAVKNGDISSQEETEFG